MCVYRTFCDDRFLLFAGATVRIVLCVSFIVFFAGFCHSFRSLFSSSILTVNFVTFSMLTPYCYIYYWSHHAHRRYTCKMIPPRKTIFGLTFVSGGHKTTIYTSSDNSASIRGVFCDHYGFFYQRSSMGSTEKAKNGNFLTGDFL